MLEQLALHTPLTMHATNEHDLNPRPCTVNDHPFMLAHEMMEIDPGEKPTSMMTWKPTSFISHIMTHSHDDSFPIPPWETWFCQNLGVPISVFLENPRQCPCRNLVSTLMGITFRRVSVNLQHYKHTNGSCISSVCCFVRLNTEWTHTRLHLLQGMNLGTLR